MQPTPSCFLRKKRGGHDNIAPMSDTPNTPETPEQAEREPTLLEKALEVRKTYGISSAALILWTAWCIHDGWFTGPEFEYKGFNKVLTVPSVLGLIFCLVMFGSAARTVARLKRTGEK